MGISPPTVVGDDGDWVEYYNGVAFYVGGQWAIAPRQWVGPFIVRTIWPGWYWYGGSWGNNTLSGSSRHYIAPGAWAYGVQYVHDFTTGGVAGTYIKTIQSYSGDSTYGPCRGY